MEVAATHQRPACAGDRPWPCLILFRAPEKSKRRHTRTPSTSSLPIRTLRIGRSCISRCSCGCRTRQESTAMSIAFDSRYQDMKHDHQKNVLKCLGMRAAGRAVLAELRARPAFSVYIFPFDFLPSGDWLPGTGALTETMLLPQTAAESARGTKPPGTQACANGACWASQNSPTGKSVDLFFTARRNTKNNADGWLLHELVHAARFISGVFRQLPMGGGYGDSEEFYANTIEMIYRSEKRLPIYDYNYQPFDAASFLERNMASVLLTDLRVAQPSLFGALAKVDAGFNPIKQLDEQRRKLLGG